MPVMSRQDSCVASPEEGLDRYLEVSHISRSYGPVRALQDVSFSLKRGQMLALLGPSGCGKSTLLNVMSGFLAADSGQIVLGGEDLTRVPPHRRGMPMVFQSYALFPHMTVEQNVAFGLKQQRVPRHERAERVKWALDLVRLPGHRDRYPSEMSGGQQQRVALARCLVIQPPVLLLDEPLSNLDAQLRGDMRDEMNEILRASETTSVFVTHDQSEGLAIADRVLILHDGVVEQEGKPVDVFERPTSQFAADFTGVANLWPGRLGMEAGHDVVQTRLGAVRCTHADGFSPGDDVVVAVRPDSIRIDRHGANHYSETIALVAEGEVASVSYLGRHRRFRVHCGETTVTADVPSGDESATVGDSVTVSVEQRRCRLVQP